MPRANRRRSTLGLSALAVALVLTSAGCRETEAQPQSASSGAAARTSVGVFSVAMILKTDTNPFFVAMADSAARAAEQQDVKLVTTYGSYDGDEAGQVAQIEAAIARKDRGIIITPNGPGVDAALRKAKAAGMLVVALDTPPSGEGVADVSFATDNFEAGKLIGQWAAKKMAGKPAVIAMLNLFDDKVVSSDLGRHQGFLTGMGIPVNDPAKMGDEPTTGGYAGGSYTIACAGETLGDAVGGAKLMTECLAENPEINLVYTINEPAASGAVKVLQAAKNAATVVSVDGGCTPGIEMVEAGTLDATAQQYPDVMAAQGVDAISAFVHEGTKPAASGSGSFVSTGQSLVTDEPMAGVPSLESLQGKSRCWKRS